MIGHAADCEHATASIVHDASEEMMKWIFEGCRDQRHPKLGGKDDVEIDLAEASRHLVDLPIQDQLRDSKRKSLAFPSKRSIPMKFRRPGGTKFSSE